MDSWTLDDDRCFSPGAEVRSRASELHAQVASLPLVSPHGHVDVRWLAEDGARLPEPSALFVSGDHYVTRLLFAHGVPYEGLGKEPRDGAPFESDPRKVWRRFCERFHLFDGTPSGYWLKATFIDVFGVSQRPSAENADAIYDQVEEALASPEFSPRRLLERFRVEHLATTDPASASLADHEAAQAAGVPVVPTFRPDVVLHPADPAWRDQLAKLGAMVGFEIDTLDALVEALRRRRIEFREAGATATDHALTGSFVDPLDSDKAAGIFDRAMAGQVGPSEGERFHSHMLFEMARMATEDGLVMQLHMGSLRNHHQRVLERFGPDMGADVPVAMDFTRGLHALLNAFGHDQRFRLVLYTLDESAYARELAPLAGHYPALRLGSPWWFHDSPNGIERYLSSTVETAGFYNLAGFVDDVRSLPTLAVRHDLWRRATCDWLARLELRGLLDSEQSPRIATWLAYAAAKDAFRVAATQPWNP